MPLAQCQGVEEVPPPLPKKKTKFDSPGTLVHDSQEKPEKKALTRCWIEMNSRMNFNLADIDARVALFMLRFNNRLMHALLCSILTQAITLCR